MSESVPQAVSHQAYPATFSVDYQDKLSRVTTLFRSILIIPIAIILGIVASGPQSVLIVINDQGEIVSGTTNTGTGILWSLFAATLFMILFRKRYPKWWFDFNVGLHRFAVRVVVYFGFLTDTPRCHKCGSRSSPTSRSQRPAASPSPLATARCPRWR